MSDAFPEASRAAAHGRDETSSGKRFKRVIAIRCVHILGITSLLLLTSSTLSIVYLYGLGEYVWISTAIVVGVALSLIFSWRLSQHIRPTLETSTTAPAVGQIASHHAARWMITRMIVGYLVAIGSSTLLVAGAALLGARGNVEYLPYLTLSTVAAFHIGGGVGFLSQIWVVREFERVHRCAAMVEVGSVTRGRGRLILVPRLPRES